jgi:hypothetical protein
MAFQLEAASGALTLLAFWSAFPRFADLGAIESISVLVGSSSPLTVPVGSPIGHVVGTFSVTGGSGTYTFTLVSDALGYFTMVGNQLQVNTTSMVVGTDAIVVKADNGAGDILELPTTVIITPVGYVPTYYLYGF